MCQLGVLKWRAGSQNIESELIRVGVPTAVAGTILEVNPALTAQPELVNTDPYGAGWMVKVTVVNTAEVDALLTSEAYAKLVH